MAVRSAGIAVWRRDLVGVTDDTGPVEVLLGHMGGPFWERRDDGAWSIPKGLPDPGEAEIDAARREFTEELGLALPPGDLVDLGEFRQSSKKTVIAWALELPVDHELDVSAVVSNTFEMEWPPRSGRMRTFPEIDRAGWFDLDTACRKVVAGQVALLERLAEVVGVTDPCRTDPR